jgi:hypothetical protein
VFFDNSNPDLHYILDQASTAQIIALWYASTSFSIFCTSDRVGRDIEDLRSHGFVPCYYFYHAFIAREWYRVYQHAAAFDRIGSRPYRFMMYCRATDGSRTYRRTVLDQLAPIKSHIHYDWESKNMVDAQASATISRDDAQAAEIHLVLETLFDTDKLYLTEKVFKPMVMNQAFIVWGPPGTLRTLRDYGFRTFHDVWSEDYDEVADPDQRMAMLIDLVRSLAAMNEKTYRGVLDKCATIIEHNRRWFYSEQFMTHCWHELTTNYEQALAAQHEMQQTFPGGQLLRLADDCPALFDFFPARRYAVRQYLQTLDRDNLKRVLQCYPRFSAL